MNFKNKKNILLTGFMGSGKTFIGKHIADLINFKFIDIDEIIKIDCNTSISNLFTTKGENYFRDLEHNVCKQIYNLDSSIISAGGGTLEYDRNLNLFLNNSVIIFIDTPFEVCFERCINTDRPLMNILSKSELYELFLKRRKRLLNVADYILRDEKLFE